MNTLSDLRLYPDVPHVNISKYRLRLHSHVAQHTYIYYTHTHTLQEQQTLLMALTFAYGLLRRPCAWPPPSACRGGSEYPLLGLDTGPKTHCLVQRFSVSFKASTLRNWDCLTGINPVVVVWFHYKTASLFRKNTELLPRSCTTFWLQ